MLSTQEEAMNRRELTNLMLTLSIVMVTCFTTGRLMAAEYLGSGQFPTNQIYRCHIGAYAAQNQNASAKWSSTTDLSATRKVLWLLPSVHELVEYRIIFVVALNSR